MAHEEIFARLRLTGGRFDGEGMPVETLAELAQYRELVIGVARAQFLKENPGRQRVSRGFFDRFQLRLRIVEEGSAVPVLERPAPEGMLLAPDDEFTLARDTIEDVVRAAGSDGPLPTSFPPDALVLFDRFGQTLRGNEAIELRRGGASSGPRYTPQTRRKLVLSQKKTYQEELQGIGRILEVDGNAMTCRIRLRLGPPSPVVAALDDVTFGPVKEALEPNGKGPPVWVSGAGEFDSEDHLIRFVSINDVTALEPEDLDNLDRRLNELSSMDAGWLDGEGESPSKDALDRAGRLLGDLLTFEVPRPRVFPTPEGAVQAEWTMGEHEISVTFEPDGRIHAIAVNVASGHTEEPDLAGDDAMQIAHLLQVT